MIHIIHTPAAELARQREKLMWRCFMALLPPAAGLICLASAYRLPITQSGDACNFTGIPFEPARQEAPLPPTPQQRALPTPRSSIHIPPVLALPSHPVNYTLPLEALPELIEHAEEDAISPFDTPAELLLETQAEQQPGPCAKPPNQQASKESGDDYTPPAYHQCPSPPYPPLLRQRRIQGEVGVLITVSAQGIPSTVDISQSSGSAALDKHARAWILRHWQFTPATRNGHPTQATVRTSIRFSLR